MSLALCRQVVSQAPQHFRSSETQATYDGCFSRQPICLVVYPEPGMSKEVHPREFFEGGCRTLIHASLDFPFHFFLFVASSSNPWGWRRVCRTLRQSSGVHGRLLPPQLSSWRLRPYRLHCLHGWWSQLAWLWSPIMGGLWWLSHQYTLWELAVCCFVQIEAWSLNTFSLLVVFGSTFPRFLAGVSHRDAGIG